MKRRGARRIYETVKDMTFEEEVEYWRQRSEELRREREARKERREAEISK